MRLFFQITISMLLSATGCYRENPPVAAAAGASTLLASGNGWTTPQTYQTVEFQLTPSVQKRNTGDPVNVLLTVSHTGRDKMFLRGSEWPLEPMRIEALRDGAQLDYSATGRKLIMDTCRASIRMDEFPYKGRFSAHVPLSDFFDVSRAGIYQFKVSYPVYTICEGKAERRDCQAVATVVVSQGN
jgi:hypothetical protein